MGPQHIFITGGTGRIGRILVEGLRKGPYNILLLSPERSGDYRDKKIRIVHGDIRSPEGYAETLIGVGTVVHMAAVTYTNDARKYYEVNTDGTLKLINACRAHGVKRFIFVSTRAISEGGGPYARSKRMAEEHVMKSGLDWVILRPAEVYGVSGNKGIDMLLNNMHKFPVIPVIGDGRYRLAPVHISDLVSTITKVIERRDIRGRIYTIAGPESLTYNEVIDRALKAGRLRKLKLHVPLSVVGFFLKAGAFFLKDNFFAVDQLPRLTCEKSDDISAAVKDFGYGPMSLSEWAVTR